MIDVDIPSWDGLDASVNEIEPLLRSRLEWALNRSPGLYASAIRQLLEGKAIENGVAEIWLPAFQLCAHGGRKPMPSESRKSVAALRHYYEKEIEAMVRQMKVEGGTMEDCIAELRLLAEFVRSQADALTDAWPSLLQETSYEDWERGQNEIGAAG